MIAEHVTLYIATCASTGKAYIGLTEQRLRPRWNQHISRARRGCKLPFHAAIRKYGVDQFSLRELAHAFSREDACVLEQALIADRNTLVPNGYNVARGGDAMAAYERTSAHRKRVGDFFREFYSDPTNLQRMREARGDVKASAETRAKMSESQKLVHERRGGVSAETRAAISAANVGRKLSERRRFQISESQRGREIPLGQRAKISAALRGREKTEAHRSNISAGRKGMQFTEEHRRNISLANQRRFARAKGVGNAST